MAEYTIRAKVDQIVTSQLRIVVLASSEEEAYKKAREAVEEFPEPVSVAGIKRMGRLSARYWIPRNVDLELEEQEPASA